MGHRVLYTLKFCLQYNTLLFVCLIIVPRKLKTLLTYMHCLLHPLKFHVLRPKRDKSILQKKLQLDQIDLGGWFLDITDTKLVKYSVYNESVKEHDSWELNVHMLMIMNNIN